MTGVRGGIRILLYNPTFTERDWNVGTFRADETCRALSRIGIEITLASPWIADARTVTQGFELKPVSRNPYLTYKQLVSLLDHGDFDLVQERLQTKALTSSGIGCMASFRTGVPLVLELHNQNGFPSFLSSIHWFPLSMWHSSLVLAYARVRGEMSFGVDPTKIVDIPNGYSSALFREVVGKEQEIYDLKERTHEKTIVGYFGELSHDKMTDSLIRVARMLRARRDLVFVFAGKGFLERLVQKESESSGSNLMYLGLLNRKETIACMAQCSLTLAIPTEKQAHVGNPVKIVESLALGVPVITTSDNVIPSELRKNCILVSDRNPETIRDTINEMTAHGEISKIEHDFSSYSVESVASRIILPAYTKLVAGTRG